MAVCLENRVDSELAVREGQAITHKHISKITVGGLHHTRSPANGKKLRKAIFKEGTAKEMPR